MLTSSLFVMLSSARIFYLIVPEANTAL